MVIHPRNRALVRQEHKDQEFKVVSSYTVCLKPAWAVSQTPSLPKIIVY